MRRLGVLGTPVWDAIWTAADREAGRPWEGWGGIAYSLAAASAAAPEGWTVAPLVKVGRDLEGEARGLLASLPNVDGSGLVPVDAPTNRVELRYTDDARRGERLTGGLPGWTWEELEPRLAGLDALFVNFISGFEVELETAERLGASFPGLLHADLHSLFLGCPGTGERRRRRLPEWGRWAACWDSVQLNGEELETLGPGEEPPAGARRVLDAGPSLVSVTLGARGALCLLRGGAGEDAAAWPAHRLDPASLDDADPRPPVALGVAPHAPVAGDPTGCGDVWGAAFVCGLVGGAGVREAAERANRLAARKMSHRGAGGLAEHLAGEDGTST